MDKPSLARRFATELIAMFTVPLPWWLFPGEWWDRVGEWLDARRGDGRG